jgi:hypothetical protein
MFLRPLQIDRRFHLVKENDLQFEVQNYSFRCELASRTPCRDWSCTYDSLTDATLLDKSVE